MAREWNGHCHRCGKKSISHTMSYLNTDLICDECDDKERARDDFAAGQAAEEAAVRGGDYNFPGVGLPKVEDD